MFFVDQFMFSQANFHNEGFFTVLTLEVLLRLVLYNMHVLVA